MTKFKNEQKASCTMKRIVHLKNFSGYIKSGEIFITQKNFNERKYKKGVTNNYNIFKRSSIISNEKIFKRSITFIAQNKLK